jgi:hypothetical protein
MSLYSDLRERFAAGVKLAFPDRGDEKYMHVSDIAACPTYAMARILGEPMLEPSPYQRVMWRQGLAMEETLVAAVRAAIADENTRVQQDKLLWVSLDANGAPIGGELSLAAYLRGTLLNVEGTSFAELPDVIFIGHPDAIARRGDEGLLLETKSERFAWEKNDVDQSWMAVQPEKPRDKYFVQGPTYAFAAKIKRFVFGVGDRVSGGVQWYPTDGSDGYDTDEHLKPLLPKMANLIDLYRKKEIPKPVPPAWGWEAVKTEFGVQLRNIECARCPYAGCIKNTNPARLNAQKTETVK